MQDKIIEMLGAGVTPVQVALACGVTEGYISQLLAQEDIAQTVRELRVQKATAYIEHDASLDTDEEVARRLVRKNLDNAFLKPMEVLKHFQVLNAAKRQSAGATQAQTPTSTVVNLHLPAVAMVEFKLTVDRQVIEVDGRSMAAMPASRVAGMLREKRAVQDMELIQKGLDNKTPMRIVTPSILDTI